MSDVPNLMLVPAGMVEQFIPTVCRLLDGKRFPGPFFFSLGQMFELMKQSRMQLWVVFEDGEEPHLIGVTELTTYPAGKVLRYCLLAGSGLRRALPLVGKVEKWAMMEGAFCSELSTHPKLASVLRRYGFRSPLMTMFKPLVNVTVH